MANIRSCDSAQLHQNDPRITQEHTPIESMRLQQKFMNLEDFEDLLHEIFKFTQKFLSIAGGHHFQI